MPLESVIEGLARGAVRVVIELVAEVVFNIAFRGTGWVILKLLRPGHAPAERTAMAVGALFWVLTLAALLWLWWNRGG